MVAAASASADATTRPPSTGQVRDDLATIALFSCSALSFLLVLARQIAPENGVLHILPALFGGAAVLLALRLVWRLRRAVHTSAVASAELAREVLARQAEIERLQARERELQAAKSAAEHAALMAEELADDLTAMTQDLAREAQEREQAQKALVHSERMAAVGTLASGVAHEFNNLHGVLLGQIERAIGLLDHAHPAMARLTAAQDALQRAASVTRNLLGLARRHDQPVREVVNLATLVDDTVGLVIGDFRTRGIELAIESHHQPRVRVDPGAIGQVLLNLLINARHAVQGSNGPRITVTTALRDGRATLAVADNGVGIPAGDLERIFLPFFTTRADHGDRSGEAGTGLGLALSRDLAEQHGGTLEVLSQLGQGTTFTLALPLHQTDHYRRSSAVSSSVVAELAGARIAVIEDEPDLRDLVVEALEEEGVLVRSSGNGCDALELVRTTRFDAIILDLQLPGLGGLDLLGELRAGGQVPPVVLVTGGEGPNPVPAGVRVVLPKPFPIAVLIASVQQALEDR